MLCYEQWKVLFPVCLVCIECRAMQVVQCKLYNARCAMQGVQCKVCCSRDNRFALADAIVGVKIAVQHALRIIQWTPTALSHCWDSITRVELDPSSSPAGTLFVSFYAPITFLTAITLEMRQLQLLIIKFDMLVV